MNEITEICKRIKKTGFIESSKFYLMAYSRTKGNYISPKENF
jgi:hypothetical protein